MPERIARNGVFRRRWWGSPSRSLAGVFGDPMLRNGHALIASASMTQFVGVLYWIFAARLYPVAVVGRNSAAIYIMLFLSGIAELNMMSTLVRFLPMSGRRTVRIIAGAYITSGAIAALISSVFLYLIPHLEPQLGFLRSGTYMALWFVFSIIMSTIFVLQDSALTGVRAAPFVPVENGIFSLLKLVLMVPFAGLLPMAGIYVSWTAAIVITVIPTNAYLFGRAIPRHLRSSPAVSPEPKFGEIRSFLIPDSLAAFFLLASTALLPLLIISRLGPAAAGHYALAWVIGYSLFLVSMNMGSSLVVETAADQSRLRQRAFRSMTHLAKLLVPLVILIIVAAPYLLLLFGRGYARTDVTPLRLLALAALPTLITNTAISVTRSQRRMRMVLGIQISICTLAWLLSVVLIGRLGITGVATAWLIAQTVTALALTARPGLWLPPRHHVRGRTIPAYHDGPDRQVQPVSTARRDPLVTSEKLAGPAERDMRWNGHPVRVTAPVPTEVWHTVASTDPSATPFQWPIWRDCICSGGDWEDASRLYELPGGRQLVLMLARRTGWPERLAMEASWPYRWGSGGVLAPGGAQPDELALVSTDLAANRAISVSVRPEFSAASAWLKANDGAYPIARTIHVAHLGTSFEDFWASSVSTRTRSNIRAARRQIEQAGIVITSGNSPELLQDFYETYLRWIDWRGKQRKMPASLARWQAQRIEPFLKFKTVASRLGKDCRIWVASWEGRPVSTAISLYGGDTAVGWRQHTDLSVPSRFRLSEVLIAEGIRHACESGCRYIELGETFGNASLETIKERLGARKYPCAEYRFEHLPLGRGWLAYHTIRRRAESWIVARTQNGNHSAGRRS
ncbi:MAG: hypothetical protein C5B60_05965 [Chloroflexi bacterium]|nr:MAG: hypothetical protein C5B60_05965 [Chloroflexota bacterium]